MLDALILVMNQIPMERDPIEATKLRQGEIARVFRSGGRMIGGPYRSLVVVREDGTAIVKTVDAGDKIGLPGSLVLEIRNAIETVDVRGLHARPKRPPVRPSTYDGVDIYLSVRKEGKEVRWSNVDYEGDSDLPILERMAKVESLFLRSRMRHDRR